MCCRLLLLSVVRRTPGGWGRSRPAGRARVRPSVDGVSLVTPNYCERIRRAVARRRQDARAPAPTPPKRHRSPTPPSPPPLPPPPHGRCPRIPIRVPPALSTPNPVVVAAAVIIIPRPTLGDRRHFGSGSPSVAGVVCVVRAFFNTRRSRNSSTQFLAFIFFIF